MVFRGISIKVDISNCDEEIQKFWETTREILGSKVKLKGLKYNRADNEVEYAIGFDNDSMPRNIKEQFKNSDIYSKLEYKVVLIPFKGWQKYNYKLEEREELYKKLWKVGKITFEIDKFKGDETYELLINRRKTKF